jgi:hypothetical protein
MKCRDEMPHFNDLRRENHLVGLNGFMGRAIGQSKGVHEA